MVIDKLPFDKYELEPSPLTQYILERKSPHMCWQVWWIFTRPSSQIVFTLTGVASGTFLKTQHNETASFIQKIFSPLLFVVVN